MTSKILMNKQQKKDPVILEFTVIKVLDELETVGEKLKLSMHGEYCPDNSLRGYTLKNLLDHPDCYMPSKIKEHEGLIYTVSINRIKS